MRENQKIRSYYKSITSILDKSGIVADRSSLRIEVGTATIYAGDFTKIGELPNGIRFCDGSSLTFIEQVEVVDEEVKMKKYTYRFVSSDGKYIFRYEKDARSQGSDIFINKQGKKIWHPEHHLHFQDAEEPRYKTHETYLSEIIEFIKYCFLSSTNP